MTRRAWPPFAAPLIEPALEEPGALAVDPVVEPVAPPAVEPVGDVEPGLVAVEEPVLPVADPVEDPIGEPADSSVPRISTREFT